MLGFVLVVAERNRKVIVSNVNANVVAYCRLRCRKNRRENLRQLNRTTTVANVTEALGCKDQESIQSSTTPDPGYQMESDKLILDTTNESQEVSPFPAGDHKAHINRRAQRNSKHKTEQKHKRSTNKVPPWNGQ